MNKERNSANTNRHKHMPTCGTRSASSTTQGLLILLSTAWPAAISALDRKGNLLPKQPSLKQGRCRSHCAVLQPSPHDLLPLTSAPSNQIQNKHMFTCGMRPASSTAQGLLQLLSPAWPAATSEIDCMMGCTAQTPSKSAPPPPKFTCGMRSASSTAQGLLKLLSAAWPAATSATERASRAAAAASQAAAEGGRCLQRQRSRQGKHP